MTFVAQSRRNMLLGAASTLATATAGAAPEIRPRPTDAAASPQIRVFATLAAAEAAAKTGALIVGEIVMVLGYGKAGDGGGVYVAVLAEGAPGGHPHARRLRVLGGL